MKFFTLIFSALILSACMPYNPRPVLTTSPMESSSFEIDHKDGDFTFASYTKEMADKYNLPKEGISELSPHVSYIEIQTVGIKDPDKLKSRINKKAGNKYQLVSCKFSMLVDDNVDIVGLNFNPIDHFNYKSILSSKPILLSQFTTANTSQKFQPNYRKATLTSNYTLNDRPTTALFSNGGFFHTGIYDFFYMENYLDGKDMIVGAVSCRSLSRLIQIQRQELGLKHYQIGLVFRKKEQLIEPNNDKNLRWKDDNYKSIPHNKLHTSFFFPRAIQDKLYPIIQDQDQLIRKISLD